MKYNVDSILPLLASSSRPLQIPPEVVSWNYELIFKEYAIPITDTPVSEDIIIQL